MQFGPAIVVAAAAGVQPRQASPSATSACPAMWASITSAMPPVPTALAALTSAASTDPCTLLKVTDHLSDYAAYESAVNSWAEEPSNFALLSRMQSTCAAFLEAEATSSLMAVATCPGVSDIVNLPGSTNDDFTASATTGASGSAVTSAPSSTTGGASAGTASSGAAAATSSKPAAGVRSGVSLGLMLGAISGGLLMLL